MEERLKDDDQIVDSSDNEEVISEQVTAAETCPNGRDDHDLGRTALGPVMNINDYNYATLGDRVVSPARGRGHER